ncbi:MAG: phage portal protein [Acidobacteriota bacterium]|nr:phage portal protein [Acidobacteriota bacterium]
MTPPNLDGAQWPPADMKEIMCDLAQYEAWWTGRITEQQNPSPDTATTTPRPNRFMRRFRLWTRRKHHPPARPSRADIHVPLAADICEASAQLLYGQPPTLTRTTRDNTDTPTRQRVNEYVNAGLWEALLEGAETGAALGGRYHRVTWDETRTAPFITTIAQDQAIPTFKWGKLQAVTFHTTLAPLAENKHAVYRHLETHETDENGNGTIRHQLYEGTLNNLGHAIPLTDHPDTSPLAGQVDADGLIITGRTPGLNVVYFPNLTPQRRWRHNPQGRYLGRSDLEDVIGLLDALDETWNSWMRDIRLAKSRVIAPRHMLEDADGKPVFDLDQELFEAVEAPGDPNGGVNFQSVQFSIRFQEHAATINELVSNIIRSAGYSRATFGENEAGIKTATEIKAREKNTYQTRERKLRSEAAALEQLIRKMLTVDEAVYNTSGLDPDEIQVAFPNIALDSPEAAAQTAATLAGARIASLATLVGMIHPDWDDDQIAGEVEAIRNENVTVTDPDQFHPLAGLLTE